MFKLNAELAPAAAGFSALAAALLIALLVGLA